ncbi:MAG: ABC transporter permease [Elusimicrobia bacterium]|nr:ABC transporter permease [Elusimicrobiota bacterium]
MSVEFFIAWRYLKARRKGVFTLLTTIIAVGGITLGVAALIITIAVMTGFQKDIREKILGIQPHLIVTKESNMEFSEYPQIEKEIKRNKLVTAAAPFVMGQAILRHRNFTTGIVLKGIDFKKEDLIVNLSRILVKSEKNFNIGENEILVGNELARNLSVMPGDEIILMSQGQIAMIPRMEKFRVKQLFHSGMYEYDSNLAFISLQTAQKLFQLKNSISGIGVSVKNWENADVIEREIQEYVAYPYWVRSWYRMNKNLFAALKLEKIMMFIILALIIIVASFNIISNLLLLSVEKSKEIGILSAIGMSRKKISKIFFYEGIIIGLSGIVTGIFLGVGLSLILKKYQFIHLPQDVYYLDKLPVKIIPADIFGITVAALIITVLAAVYPAYQVTKLDPLEAIRYG